MSATRNVVLRGDCVEVMRSLPADSIDAIVTDPPYGIEFMGKEWDKFSAKVAKDAKSSKAKFKGQGKYFTTAEGSGIGVGGPRFSTQTAADARVFQTWTEQWAREAFRVLKPGGHLLAFGGTRMYHRLATGVEDAGFEVRDMMSWIYGSGFPKSLDVSKAMDKRAGAERPVVSTQRLTGTARIIGGQGGATSGRSAQMTSEGALRDTLPITAPATEEAKRWEGWGTALKPAQEPIVVARKPLIGTVAENVLTHGTGAINIDVSRIAAADSFGGGAKGTSGFAAGYEGDGWTPGSSLGRWPANVFFDEEAAAELDAQAPGASRFFYVAKPGKKERNAGLVGLDVRGKVFNGKNVKPAPSNEIKGSVNNKFSTAPQANTHPTVKPIALMGYLIKLVTPPGGVVLDPFLGSGSTACAAILNGFDYLGIEQSAEYADIAEARIAHYKKETD